MKETKFNEKQDGDSDTEKGFNPYLAITIAVLFFSYHYQSMTNTNRKEKGKKNLFYFMYNCLNSFV